MVESACRAQRLVLTKVADGAVGVCSTAVLDEVAEDALIVVANDEDFADLGEFGDGGEAVGDDGVAGYLEQWLGRVSSPSGGPDLSCLRLPLEGPKTVAGNVYLEMDLRPGSRTQHGSISR